MLRLNEERTIRWIGDVDEERVRGTIKKLQALENQRGKKQDIHLLVCSGGGDISAGLAFFEFVRRISTLRLTSIGLGGIKSMGVIIFLAAQKRLIAPSTHFLFHEPNLKYTGSPTVGKSESGQDHMLMTLEDNLCAKITFEALEGRHSLDEILRWSKENRILSANEALALGLAHEIIT